MLHCLHCGYNLTGVCTPEQRVGVCPECGKPFSYDELVRTGGVEQKNLTWPLLLLLAPPVVFGLVLTAMIFYANAASSGSALDEPAIWWAMVLMLGGSAIGVSIFTGRRIARRLAMRPANSAPNVSSVTLTIVLAFVFTSAQLALCFCIFFCGCLCALSL